ncbi:MAG: T9SS type A sorting domain-containing protein, partial [Bacteroidetes bacterium]|nr:T9SS type A sorting domain-containing protein [Bacteroidota bacterium]
NYPSTKENLLIQILDFFGGIITGDHDEAGLYEPVSTLINYPNPFGNYTNILFSLKESEKIQLEIYNLNGQKIGILCHKELEEGSYRFVWDGKDQGQNSLPGGIYICKLSSGKFILTRKIILVE